MNIELYIKNRLCDIDSPESLGIRLKRLFINPAELSVKDAQKSYEITLPATPVNNEVFSHVNVEEVQGKFRIYEDARLYVDGILILDGKFRLSEITQDSYKGNLGVPASREIKDIFGEKVMSEAGSWLIKNFKGLDSISEYNQMEKPPFMFPLVLYGLLPKDYDFRNGYPDKNVLDFSANLGLDDLPPSVNCIEMLKQIFKESKLSLSGTALADERLNSLYVSYKNPDDYQFDWGAHETYLSGDWKYYREDLRALFDYSYQTNEETSQFNINVLKSTNHTYIIHENDGGNITKKNRSRDAGLSISIPYSGLYKIELNCHARIGEMTMFNDRRIGVDKGDLDTAPMEIHLVRNLEKALSEVTFNNKFAYDNINQEIDYTNSKFPQKNKVNFIDPKQDENFLCGFSFGKHKDADYRNPLNQDYCNPMAISGGQSWDFANGEGTTFTAHSAVESPSYLGINEEPLEADFFRVDLKNANTYTQRNGDRNAIGKVNQIVWLEKGDKLDLLLSTLTRKAYNPITNKNQTAISDYSISYDLRISPFQHTKEWLKMNNQGSSSEQMDWNTESSFTKGQFDLMKTLPSNVKINDWIDNFCKAFNLNLLSTKNGFSLDLKDRRIVTNTSAIIDLDGNTSIKQSRNLPLNLPYSYELGFTIDTAEEGYFSTEDDGGGIVITDKEASNKVSQKSNFSKNWFKTIKLSRSDETIDLPVITDHEIWEYDYDYKEMMTKTYFDKAQRFWYKSGVTELNLMLDKITTIALVSNEYTGVKKLTLDYKDKADSITRSYFSLFSNNNNYTTVECYLTPEEYSNLDKSLVRLNGDLYHIAEVDGYDPLGKNKCTIKLIRRTIGGI